MKLLKILTFAIIFVVVILVSYYLYKNYLKPIETFQNSENFTKLIEFINGYSKKSFELENVEFMMGQYNVFGEDVKFNIHLHVDENGKEEFKIKLSDGTSISDFDTLVFENGRIYLKNKETNDYLTFIEKPTEFVPIVNIQPLEPLTIKTALPYISEITENASNKLINGMMNVINSIEDTDNYKEIQQNLYLASKSLKLKTSSVNTETFTSDVNTALPMVNEKIKKLVTKNTTDLQGLTIKIAEERYYSETPLKEIISKEVIKQIPELSSPPTTTTPEQTQSSSTTTTTEAPPPEQTQSSSTTTTTEVPPLTATPEPDPEQTLSSSTTTTLEVPPLTATPEPDPEQTQSSSTTLAPTQSSSTKSNNKPNSIPATENFQQLVKEYFGTSEQKDNIINKYGYISTWDTSEVTNMLHAFKDLTTFTGVDDGNVETSQDINTKLVKYTDSDGNKKEYMAWNTSEVTNMSYMFKGAKNFNGDISSWDTSRVENMVGMFFGAEQFNKDINTKIVEYTENGIQKEYTAWNTGKVTNITQMFYEAKAFNGDISNWDTSSVTKMNSMFVRASFFNPLEDKDINTKVVDDIKINANGDLETYTAWDTSSVTGMNLMFYEATEFNSNISNWDTSSVTGMDSMFNKASSFNQDISTKVVDDIRINEEGKKVSYTAWDTKNVTDMYATFSNSTSFNGDISNWDTSSVKDMIYMFSSASSFNQDINTKVVDDIRINEEGKKVSYTAWDTKNVTDMHHTFNISTRFNGDISRWDTSSITNMSNMFYRASSFNQDINKKVVENVRINANGDLETYTAWDTSEVTNMKSMFYEAIAFNQDISNWDTSKVTNMHNMFYWATSFLNIYGELINDKGIPNFNFFNQEGFQNPDITSTDEYKSVDNVLTTYTSSLTSNEIIQMRDFFELLYRIVPIENKKNIVSTIKSILIKEYRRESEPKEVEYIYPKEEKEVDSSKVSNDVKKNIVHNVAVPMKDYMSQIIRPQDWSKALRPPSCIRDSVQLNDPVELVDDGIPSSIHNFTGVGSILPKFAYTEVYDPKYYD